MKMKISGIDKLQKQMEEIEHVTAALDGSYNVTYDANDPTSIENAIQVACSLVDERASQYQTNPLVIPIIEQLKETLRERILHDAEQQRNGEKKDDH
ncbi:MULTISPECIES: hypothetical protein [Providencia]|uniref:hypothetical protein n=1 Tax=Providencia TaxID=586 RepID=UPI00235EEA41|nr:hypothetical protein [Providencia rettgeri]